MSAVYSFVHNCAISLIIICIVCELHSVHIKLTAILCISVYKCILQRSQPESCIINKPKLSEALLDMNWIRHAFWLWFSVGSIKSVNMSMKYALYSIYAYTRTTQHHYWYTNQNDRNYIFDWSAWEIFYNRFSKLKFVCCMQYKYKEHAQHSPQTHAHTLEHCVRFHLSVKFYYSHIKRLV